MPKDEWRSEDDRVQSHEIERARWEHREPRRPDHLDDPDWANRESRGTQHRHQASDTSSPVGPSNARDQAAEFRNEIVALEAHLKTFEAQKSGAVEHLLAYASRIESLHRSKDSYPKEFAGLETGLSAVQAHAARLLDAHKDQLLCEVFAIAAEIQPLKARSDQLKDALRTLFRHDGSEALTLDAPDGVGKMSARKREATKLPPTRAAARSELDQIVKQSPQYWARASILQAARLQVLIHELKLTDPKFVEQISPYIRTQVVYSLYFKAADGTSIGDTREQDSE